LFEPAAVPGFGFLLMKAISLETSWKSMLPRGAIEELNRNHNG
jgi:hypothetical protein